MDIISQGDVDWLKEMINYGISKSENDLKKQDKLRALLIKIDNVIDPSLKINVTSKDISDVHEILDSLEKVLTEYTNTIDISNVDLYDNYKKRVAANLASLSALHSKLQNESSKLEDYLKKELRTSIIKEMMENGEDPNGKKFSFTQADKMVEIDETYLIVKRQVTQVTDTASLVKIKYGLFTQLWQMIFQNVSVATKESYMSKVNNDT